MLLKVVLDTNALLRSISRKSKYSMVLEKLESQQFELCVSTPILLEYEEKISSIFTKETAELLLGAFMLLPNVKRTEIHFQLSLIRTDFDDNKFADCAFAGNAHYVVTDDKHFNSLSNIDFPKINVLPLEDFTRLLREL